MTAKRTNAVAMRQARAKLRRRVGLARYAAAPVDGLLTAAIQQKPEPNALRQMHRDVRRIVKITARQTEVSAMDIVGKSRVREVALARMMAITVIGQVTNLSSAEIGRQLGRDHTTILNAWRRIDELRSKHSDIDDMVDHIARLSRRVLTTTQEELADA